MANRLAALLCLVALAFCACSDDDDPAGPVDPANTSYVDANTGDDAGTGSSLDPWETISHAVATAPDDFTIRVAPGTYDAANNGETFPIRLQPGQQLIGDTTNKGLGAVATRIQGEAVFSHGQMFGTVMIGAAGARMAGFAFVTVTDPNLYAGIAVVAADMEIDHNTFEADLFCGVSAVDDAAPDIHDNLFLSRTYGLYLDGAGAVHLHDNVINSRTGLRAQPITGAVIEDNSLTSVGTGIDIAGTGTIRNNQFLQTAAYTIGAIRINFGSPVIRGNVFASGGPALVVQQSGNPDAGTGASPGQNDFRAIVGVAMRHEGTASVMAVGNGWPNVPPVVGTDIVITGTGSVTWQP